MAEYYKFDDSGKFEAEQRIKFLSQKDAPAALPATGSGSGSGRPAGAGNTYVSNITIPGIGSASPVFADQASQRQTEELLRKLAQAKGVAQ